MKNILLFSVMLMFSSFAFSQKKVIGKYINEKSQITSSESSNFVFPVVLENGTENGDFRKIDIDTLVKIFEGSMDFNQGLKTEHGFAPPESGDSVLKINGTGLLSDYQIKINKGQDGFRIMDDEDSPTEPGGQDQLYVSNNSNNGGLYMHFVTRGEASQRSGLKATVWQSNKDIATSRGVMTFEVEEFNFTDANTWAGYGDGFTNRAMFEFMQSPGSGGGSFLKIFNNKSVFYHDLDVQDKLTASELVMPTLSYTPTSSTDLQAETINASIGATWTGTDSNGIVNYFYKKVSATKIQRIAFADF